MAKTYLAKLASGAPDLFNGRNIEQFAAICYRKADPLSGHAIDVLLITTRSARRWVVPKGWAIAKKRPHEVAEREAWEEAGVKGKIKKRPYGYYTYMKSVDGVRRPSVVQVFLLEVTGIDARFPEKGERKVEWFPALEASTLVEEPELKSLIARLENDMRGKRARHPVDP